MKNKILVIGLILIILSAGGYAAFALSDKPKEETVIVEETPADEIEALDPAVVVDVTRSRVKDNTVVLQISGLGSQYTSVSYELSYESQGIVQGVTSRPLEIFGKDSFVRDDIYLGTCSRNVCRPHTGVKKISVVLEFTNLAGKKSQFSKDFDL